MAHSMGLQRVLGKFVEETCPFLVAVMVTPLVVVSLVLAAGDWRTIS